MEAPVLGLETHVLLRHYLEEGLSRAAIAQRLGINERTIRRWIAQGELDRSLDEPPRYKARPKKATKLDPYTGIVRARLEVYPELSSVRLLEEIRAAGYTGGYTQLTLLVQKLRPRTVPEVPVRFETAPGHQAQVDFAVFDFPWGRRYALLVVLGYSRLLWLRFYRRQDMATLLRGLEEAFAYFGGVPRELLFDQMKAVITRDLRLLGGQLVVNEEFLRFAAHWSFRARACRPYRAQTKGKVERPIRYVRENLVYGRDFTGDAHLEEELRRWLERANSRRHATTGEAPRLRFERDEGMLLMPLAQHPYRSLVLPAQAASQHRGGDGLSVTPGGVTVTSPVPRLVVEKRPLSVYAALSGGDL